MNYFTMCMNNNLLNHLFGKKNDDNTNEGIILETVIDDGVILETEVTPEQQDEESETEITPELHEEDEIKETNIVILLDNGHARSTPGKRGPFFSDGSRFFEWEFNRDVVARIARGLDKLKIKYHVLVPETEEDVPLPERARRANEYCKKYGTKNCFFISVHSNAYGDGIHWENKAGGWEVYTTVGVTKSDDYAKIIYGVAEEMLKPYGFKCRNGKGHKSGNPGPDYEENFTVIYKTWCPAILTENLFFTNEKESTFLMTNEGRQLMADIHIEGIRRIIKNL